MPAELQNAPRQTAEIGHEYTDQPLPEVGGCVCQAIHTACNGWVHEQVLYGTV